MAKHRNNDPTDPTDGLPPGRTKAQPHEEWEKLMDEVEATTHRPAPGRTNTNRK